MPAPADTSLDALQLAERRWLLRIVRQLLTGPLRFGDLRALLPRLSANILSQRLSEMADADIVVREELPPPARVQVYALTAKGRALGGVLEAIFEWEAQHMGTANSQASLDA